jgi:hypothetical protein
LTTPHDTGLEGGAKVASVLVAMLLIGAGVLHVSAAGDHTNLPVMTVGFLVVATLQAGLGGLLLLRRSGRLVVAGGLALTLGALATWLVSRTAGLPFLPGGHMEPIGFKDGITVLFEVATVPLLALLASAELDRARLPSPRLGSQAVAVLGSAMFALFVPALVLGGGEHHSASDLAHAHDDEGHSDGTEELAHAEGGHGHAEGSMSGGGHDHGSGDEHGRHATAGVLADAHQSATGHAHDEADLGLGSDGGMADVHSHQGGDHDRGDATGGGGGTDGGGGDNHGSGGHEHGSGGEEQDGSPHRDGDHDGDGGEQDADHEHGSGGHDDGAPAENERALAIESGHPEEDGRPARGPAVVVYDRADEGTQGPGHHAGACDPTAAQQAAADGIVTDVQAELRQYENNPAEALADGFNYVFGPTDRMLHMVHLPRVSDPDVLKAGEIESFIYYMTDTGFVPIGGMFVMPQDATSGPEPGGCLTQWHHHGGFVGRWATAGTSESTPLMMHVFTYPGLDPWGHYDGRDLAPLWTPGRWVPSVCRSANDANNGCLP